MPKPFFGSPEKFLKSFFLSLCISIFAHEITMAWFEFYIENFLEGEAWTVDIIHTKTKFSKKWGRQLS